MLAGILIISFACIISFGKALECQIKKLGWNDSSINNLKVLLIVFLILSFGIFVCTLMPK